jgi:hypothetical protein
MLVSRLAYSSEGPPKRLLTFNGLHGVISQKTKYENTLIMKLNYNRVLSLRESARTGECDANSPGLHPGGARFQSWPGHLLS